MASEGRGGGALFCPIGRGRSRRAGHRTGWLGVEEKVGTAGVRVGGHGGLAREGFANHRRQRFPVCKRGIGAGGQRTLLWRGGPALSPPLLLPMPPIGFRFSLRHTPVTLLIP